MKTPISKSEKTLYIIWSAVLFAGILFFIFYHLFDMQLYTGNRPCGFKYIFHLYCAGCGGTRAVDCFLHGKLIRSFLYHPAVVYIAGFFISYYIPTTLRMIGLIRKKINDMIYVSILIGLLVIIILNVVLRNVLMVNYGLDYIGECVKYWI